MKNLKKIVAIFCLIIVVSCSKDDATTPTLDKTVTIISILPTTGPKNTAVVLTGTGFSSNIAANLVTLNGKICTVNSATATTLNITIPPAAGTGKIKVTVGNDNAESTVFDYIETVVVSTFAGSTTGFLDGTGLNAKFNLPSAVAVDANGNVYVADGLNNCIRKINPTGVVSTLAGNSLAVGFANGTGAAAQFSEPLGVAVDGSGNVYVADRSNHRIRKITPAGAVTTLAGSTEGFANGTGTAAQFNDPIGITVDVNGNIYVTDTDNNKIRKVTPAGVVTILAGSTAGFADGIGTVAQFNYPYGITVDASGNVYVADRNNHKIRKISPAGAVNTIAGSTLGFLNGAGTIAQFNEPSGIAIDLNGNLFVSDAINHKIRKISSTNQVTTVAGSTGGFANGSGTVAQFNIQQGIALDNSGNIYVADINNEKIRKITID
jgi:sugar lactone lactonase YvrE